MNCDDSPGLAWTQQDLYIPQPTILAQRSLDFWIQKCIIIGDLLNLNANRIVEDRVRV